MMVCGDGTWRGGFDKARGNLDFLFVGGHVVKKGVVERRKRDVKK